MNRINAICGQIDKIGEFVADDGYSLLSLCQVRGATLNLLAGEILKRERAPLNAKEPDGSAA